MLVSDKVLFEKILTPSTFETIDYAIYNYIDKKINLSVNTTDGFTKVPILWLGAEKSFQIKNNPELRDENGQLKLPIMVLERSSVSKDPNFKGSFQAHWPDGPGPKRLGVPIARRIVQDKTSQYVQNEIEEYFNSILKNDPRFYTTLESETGITESEFIKSTSRLSNKIIYHTIYAPIPTYVKVMYKLTIRTNYQTQMNDLVTPFITRTGQINAFGINSDSHRYEVFVEQSYDYNNTLNNEVEERFFETSVQFKVLGYLMGEGVNDDKPKFSLVENIVEVKLPRERVIVGGLNPGVKKTFYR